MMPDKDTSLTTDDEWSNVVSSRTDSIVDNTAAAAPDQEDEHTALTVSDNADGKPSDGDPAINATTDNSKADTGVGLPARYIFTLLGFQAFFTMYCLRTCLNVAMVAMVNSTALAEGLDGNSSSSGNNTSSANSRHQSSDCLSAPASNSSKMTTELLEGEFLWDERTQGFILGAFYYGYMIPQLFGGWLAGKLQGKRLLGGSLLVSSLLSFAIPSAARAGSAYLTALRALQGLAESMIYPAMHAMCAKWVPVHERSKLVSFSYSGAEMGIVCGMLLTGLLSRYGFAGGWPSAFYIFGLQGCVWFTMWMVLVYESPAHHPRISDSERRYIASSLGHRDRVDVSIPWRAILTSAPVWAVCIAHFAYNWGYYSMFTSLPTFLKQILHFGIVTNGFLSALPYLLMGMTQVLGGIVSDVLRGYLSTGLTRKLMYTIGSVFPAVFLIGTGYVDCDHTLAVVLLTVGVSGKGFAASSYMVNHLDFAPRFAGTLFGLSNTIASIPGFTAPYIIGVLTNHNQTIAQWRKFFFITAAVYAASILTFLWLAKGEVRAWAAPPPTCTTIPVPLLQKEKSAEEEKAQLQ